MDDYYARYAQELDPAKRKLIAKELATYMADKMYWNVREARSELPGGGRPGACVMLSTHV